MRGRRKNAKDTLDMLDILSIISITIVASLLIVLFKVKAGILGIGLGAIAVATLIYWVKEAKKIFREEEAYLKVKRTIDKKEGEAKWFYDLIDYGESMKLTAEVPGPAEEVNVRLHEGTLEIRGGRDFTRSVQVSKGVRVQDWSHSNGVLHVRLQKLRRQGSMEFINE